MSSTSPGFFVPFNFRMQIYEGRSKSLDHLLIILKLFIRNVSNFPVRLTGNRLTSVLNNMFLFARWRQLSVFKMAAYTDDNFKQKAVIEFLLKEGIAAKKISDRLKTIAGIQRLVIRLLGDG